MRIHLNLFTVRNAAISLKIIGKHSNINNVPTIAILNPLSFHKTNFFEPVSPLTCFLDTVVHFFLSSYLRKVLWTQLDNFLLKLKCHHRPNFSWAVNLEVKTLPPSHFSYQCFGKQQKREISHFIVRRKVTKPLNAVSSSAVMTCWLFFCQYLEFWGSILRVVSTRLKMGNACSCDFNLALGYREPTRTSSLAGKETCSVLHHSSSQLPRALGLDTDPICHAAWNTL